LYDDQGVYLAHEDVFLDSPHVFVETLSYHEALDYTLTPGEQYTLEVSGWNFDGVVEQPHSVLAEFLLYWFYAGEIVGIIFLGIALVWVCIALAGCGIVIEEVDKRKARKEARKIEFET
jgi:hypothetical protein